jgi:hypothetical protein
LLRYAPSGELYEHLDEEIHQKDPIRNETFSANQSLVPYFHSAITAQVYVAVTVAIVIVVAVVAGGGGEEEGEEQQ